MKYLLEEDIIQINSFILDETKGSHGIRDRDALSSIAAQPRQKTFNKELYPDIYKKAACYIRGIIFNHPFVDGNKRTAITAAFLFLEDNGFRSVAKKGEIEKFTLEIIDKKLGIEEITIWLKENIEEL